MDRYEERAAWISSRLNCRVRIVDILPNSLEPKLFAKVRGGASGWFDQRSGEVCLYRRNLSGDLSRMDASVAYLHISRNGLEGFLGIADYRHLCIKVSQLANRSGAASFSIDENARVGNRYIYSLDNRHTESWDRIADLVAEITGLKPSYSLAESICKGMSLYKVKVLENASKTHDFKSLGSHVKDSLSEISDRSSLLSLGIAGDVFLRLGYPQADVILDTQTIKTFAERNDVSSALLSMSDELFRIHEPIAVVRENNSNSDIKRHYLTFITDNYFEGRGYLSFKVESPDDIRKGFASNQYRNIKVRSVRYYSEYSIIQALSFDKGSRIEYLKPKFGKDGNSYVMSELLSRWEGRSAESLGYIKSADGKVQGVTPSQLSRRLIMVTNIVENFKNPMSSERRMKIYGKNLFESMAEKNKDNFIDTDLRTVKPAPVRQEADNRTYKERLNSYLDVEYFSAGALKKLNSAGLFKAMDIISIGADAFKERFGLRTFKAARSFLDANRLDFSGFHRIPTISEHSLEGMSPDELGKVKERDLVNSLSNIPDNVISRQIRMPRNSVGQYFSGADCISLIAKSVSIPRWRDCNIFLSKEELDSLRLVVNRGAIPCHIADVKGKPITVYNLSETDFAISYPSMFDALSDMSRNTSAEVPAYVKNLIYGYSGIGLADASKVYQRFNQGYANNVDMEQLGPQSMSVKELAGHSARKLGIKNPLERRGRKARPKDVLKGMEHSMKNGKGNVVKHRK